MRLTVFLLAMALVAAACSPDGGSEATTLPEPTVVADTTTTTAATTVPTTQPPITEPPTTSTSAPTTTTTTLPPLQGVTATEVMRGLARPILALAAPGEPDRLYVVEKVGRVLMVEGQEVETFLDVTDLVSGANEQGLLGLAFHPQYDVNGRLFLHYTDRSGDTALVEYRAEPGLQSADPDSARLLLAVDQPARNHNGGMLAFGPDGYLYLGLGDGGGSNDQFGHGQNPDSLMGAILRIDVDQGDPYAVPGDNPFVAGGGAPEVWAWGLRNPWRFAIDSVDGLLYIGDVGQGRWEEIDVAVLSAAGLNFGWPITEGLHCFRPSSGCDTGGLVLPVLEYSHSEGCSVTGGVVYRGRAIPELAGHYFYADYCSGWIRSFRFQSGEAVEQEDWTGQLGRLGNITSFGTDAAGEVYVLTDGGGLWRIDPMR